MVWQGKYDRLYIGGRWVAPKSDKRIDVISPYSEQVIATVPSASKADVDDAVAAARRAFDEGPWPRMTVAERSEVLGRLGILLKTHQDRMGQLICDELGSPVTFSKTLQAGVPILMIDEFREIARTFPLSELRQSATGNALVRREPKGVVAGIMPWNVPMMTTMIKLAPCLLMGCPMLIKPASETPLSSYLLAELLSEAGVPEGVVSVLPADRHVAEYLVTHPGVDKVTFTGSTFVGRHLAMKCADLIRPITLELGGKSAAIFLDDADIEASVESLRLGSFRNSGQVCSLKTRILVSRKGRERVLDALGRLVDSMPVGDPNDPATQIGPMSSAKQMETVTGYIEKGMAEGGRLVRGGLGRPEGLNHGFFVRPTVFADVKPTDTIFQEEIFGPVLAVATYETEDEAVAMANDSIYGLNGAIFSADIDKAVAMAGRIRTGTVEINGGGVGFRSPIGGVRQSGIGREGGVEGFEPYTEIKSIGLPRAYADRLAG